MNPANKLMSSKIVIGSLIVNFIAVLLITFRVSIFDYFYFGLNFWGLVLSTILINKIQRKTYNPDLKFVKPALFFSIFFTFLNTVVFIVMRDEMGVDVVSTLGFTYIIVVASQLITIYFSLNLIFVKLFKSNDHYNLSPHSLRTKLIFVFIAYFLINMLMYAIFYPGIYTPDSLSQLNQAMGYEPFNNHHPIFMSELVRITINIGQKLGFSQNGVGFYILIQVIFNTIVYSVITIYLMSKNVSKLWIMPFIVYIFFNPVTYFYNQTMWKDVPLAIFFLIFTALNTEYIFNTDKLKKNKKFVIIFWIVTLIFSLWKSNSIYAILLGFGSYIIFIKDHRKFNLLFLLSIYTVNSFIVGPIYDSISVEFPSVQEALSIPFQQIGGILSSPNSNVTEHQLEELDKYISVDVASNDYIYYISDPIKSTFDEENFAKDKLGFFQAWLDLVFDNFPLAIEATIKQTSRYYSLPNDYHTGNITIANDPERYADPLYPAPLLGISPLVRYLLYGWRLLRLIPIISGLWSIGLYFWIGLCLFYVYTKKYSFEKALVLTPAFGFWLTIFASPVNGEYRYAFPFILVVLYLVAYVTKENSY